MDFSEVIEQLRILNGHTERMSAGQIDIIKSNKDLIERIDSLAGTVGKGIKTDVMLANDAARRERLQGLKGGDSDAAKKNQAERRAEDGLLTTLVTGITAAAATFYGALAGIALAGTRFTNALEDAEARTVELVRGTIGFFSTVALMTKTMRAFTGISAAVVAALITAFELTSRIFTKGGVIAIAINGFGTRIANFFSGLATSFVRLPGVARAGSILNGIGKVFMSIFRMIIGVGRAIVPFFGIITRVFGVIVSTIGRFSGILTIVMIAVDALRGAFRGFQETGTIIGAIRGALHGVVQGFAQMFADIGVFLGWLTESVVGLLPFFSSEAAAGAGNAVRGFFDTLSNWVSGIGGFFADLTSDVLNLVINPADQIQQWADDITGFVDRLGSMFSDGFDSLINAAGSAVAGMLRAVAESLPSWTPGRGSLIAAANGLEALAGAGMVSTAVLPGAPTSRSADNIDMRPTERAQFAAFYAPTVNQTNVSTANQSNMVMSNLPDARDRRWAAIR